MLLGRWLRCLRGAWRAVPRPRTAARGAPGVAGLATPHAGRLGARAALGLLTPLRARVLRPRARESRAARTAGPGGIAGAPQRRRGPPRCGMRVARLLRLPRAAWWRDWWRALWRRWPRPRWSRPWSCSGTACRRACLNAVPGCLLPHAMRLTPWQCLINAPCMSTWSHTVSVAQ